MDYSYFFNILLILHKFYLKTTLHPNLHFNSIHYINDYVSYNDANAYYFLNNDSNLA